LKGGEHEGTGADGGTFMILENRRKLSSRDVAQEVVDKLAEIHKNNETVDETGDGEYITAADLDDDLIRLVGDNMLFTCPSDVFEYLPEKIRDHFLPSTVSSSHLRIINERSLELGLTKPTKPKGSHDPDPDFDGIE
jgi:hypothetical protein